MTQDRISITLNRFSAILERKRHRASPPPKKAKREILTSADLASLWQGVGSIYHLPFISKQTPSLGGLGMGWADIVKPGQLLVQIDDADLRAQLQGPPPRFVLRRNA